MGNGESLFAAKWNIMLFDVRETACIFRLHIIKAALLSRKYLEYPQGKQVEPKQHPIVTILRVATTSVQE